MRDTLYTTANIPVFLMRSLTATLIDLGLDPSRLMIGLGLSLQDLDDPSCRVSFRQGREIIRRALQIGRVHALGLETGIRESVTSIGLVGYAMLTCATAGEAIALAIDLQKQTGSMLEFDFRRYDKQIAVTAASRFHDPEIYVFLVEEAFASFMVVARGLVGDRFRPTRVDFAYAEPANTEAYHRIFQCDLAFGKTENAFHYEADWHATPLKTADLLAHREVMSYIAHSRSRSLATVEIIESVERILRQNLGEAPSFEGVARKLAMSERTLRRRLSDCGVTFQSMLDGQRKIRALELLGNPQISVEQIAMAVGFTDTHNFRRAFRRWTGSTPGALRADVSRIWPPETPKLA